MRIKIFIIIVLLISTIINEALAKNKSIDMKDKLGISGNLEYWLILLDNPSDASIKINSSIFGGEIKYGFRTNRLIGISIDYWNWDSGKYKSVSNTNLETKYSAIPVIANLTYYFDLDTQFFAPYVKGGVGLSWVTMNVVNSVILSDETMIISSKESTELRLGWQTEVGSEWFLDPSISFRTGIRYLYGGYSDLAGFSFGGGLNLYF